MATWILTITDEFPEHWDFAKSDGFWDTRKRPNIEKGDEVFFWMSKGTFVGWARATTSIFELTSNDPPAQWNDVSTGGYKYRFELKVISSQVLQHLTWTEMSDATGNKALASNGSIEIKNLEGQLFLPTLFKIEPFVDVFTPMSPIIYELGDDMRTKAIVEIADRRGQSKFRSTLKGAYAGRCAITGSSVLSVLEAALDLSETAHIDRYFGENSHHVTNGLLLRADVHTLFDLQRITVDESLLIRVDPALIDTEYWKHEGNPLLLPTRKTHHPDADALSRHRASCSWFSPVPRTE